MSITTLIERHDAQKGVSSFSLFLLFVYTKELRTSLVAPASYLFTMASRQGERTSTSVANKRKVAPDKTGAKPKKGSQKQKAGCFTAKYMAR
jgi:hypothetical protein